MKQLILCIIIGLLLTLPIYAVEVNTNTALTIPNTVEKVESSKLLIGEWKDTIHKIKAEGFSFGLLGGLLVLILATIISIGVIIVMIINIIQFFTNDEIDAKLEVIEDWIIKYMITLPIKGIKLLRGAVKKK